MSQPEFSSQPPENGAARDAENGETIREEIARVDAELLGLAARRLKLVESLDGLETERPVVAPARETATLRGLLQTAGEYLEPDFIIEMWRALFGAEARRRGPVDVAVAGTSDPVRLFDLARRHFGTRTRISRALDPQNALTKALEQPNTLAIAPWPAAPGVGSWWPALSETRFSKLSLIAGLPLRRPEGVEPEAGVFALTSAEPAGEDMTMMIVFDPHHRMQRAFAEVGLAGTEVSRSEPRALVRVEGFVTPKDPRVIALRGMGLDAVRVLGSFARI